MIRVLIRTSKWAIWSRRLGSFALPLLIIPIFLHRSRGITSETFALTMGIAMAIATLALIAGLIAGVRLWRTGDRGWGRAVTGIFLALVCLSPIIYAAVQINRFPMVTDVTTEWDDPPALVAFGNPDVNQSLREEVVAAFPNAVSRTYRLAPEIVFELAEGLIADHGWDIRIRRLPGLPQRPGNINATVMTLAGWRDEIALTLAAVGNGTRVAMRSRSMFGVHDLGVNGARIEGFLLDLDTAVSDWIRDHPVIVGQ